MPKRNGKFFLKKETTLLDQIEPKKLREDIYKMWPDPNDKKVGPALMKILFPLYYNENPGFKAFVDKYVEAMNE